MRESARRIEVSDERTAVAPSWCVLVVDDEPEVRQITRLVLGDVRFDGRPLDIIDAASAAEARSILASRNDIAVLLLDVVMETSHAGLDLVRAVREELGNAFVRIILRTGQPGEAPEQEVVAAYDINDYREKTDITAAHLVSMLYTALRSYRDLRTIEAQRHGLEQVFNVCSRVFRQRDDQGFINALLQQVGDLVGAEVDLLCCELPVPTSSATALPPLALAGTGRFNTRAPHDVQALLSPAMQQALRDAVSRETCQFTPDGCVVPLTAGRGDQYLALVCLGRTFSDLERQLLQLLGHNVGIAWDDLHLATDLVRAQQEMVYLLASTAETRSKETASHVHRVGVLARTLGLGLGLEQPTCELLGLAAPLHDIGKVGIPDTILNKPGPHTPAEAAIMRTHAELGARLLRNSRRPVMQLAAEIALTHHENWDGSGYPHRLSGAAIPMSGRITMAADVFDALGSRRCYKDAWQPDAVRNYMQQQRGVKFDPDVLDCLLRHWDEAMALREQFPD